MLVGPFDALSNDASVGSLFGQVWSQLVQRVGRLELATIQRAAVTDHDLRRVLVGHHDGGLGQLRANRTWVVGHQGLLGHAAVLVPLLLERPPIGSQRAKKHAEVRCCVLRCNSNKSSAVHLRQKMSF